MKKVLLVSILAASLGVTSTQVMAAEASANMQVSANVSSVCSVAVDPLSFGDYNPISSSPTDASTTVRPFCTNGQAYTLSANGGLHGNIAQRAMQDQGGDSLNYNIYTDEARSIIWGDGTTGGSQTIPGTGSGAQQAVTVYGRIPASQTVAQDSYTDTTAVTLTYTV